MNTWLRHCSPTDDKNRWRWPLSSLWRDLSAAYPSPDPVLRLRPDPNIKKEQLIAQAKGVLKTVAAYDRATSKDAYASMLEVLNLYDSSGFEAEIIGRQQLLGMDELTDEIFDDTSFSAGLRAEQMLSEGFS